MGGLAGEARSQEAAEALCAQLAPVFVCGVVWCPGVCVCCACWAVQKILRRTFSLSRAAPGSPNVGSRMVLVLGRWVGTFKGWGGWQGSTAFVEQILRRLR